MLLTVVGQDEISKQPIDIEIAVPVGQVARLIEHLQRVSGQDNGTD